jgi:hypothetical protein
VNQVYFQPWSKPKTWQAQIKNSRLKSVEDVFGETPEPTLDLKAQLETLGNQLVWKIGKDEISGAVIVRVGYASATQSFRDLPRLFGATDQEIAAAAKDGALVVEWIE